MARHRNVRQLGLDDISTYDEALASSVDDDYGISPNTAERYLYNADKRNMNSLMFFGKTDEESLQISEADFPVIGNTNDEYSPGYITGRIKSDQNDRPTTIEHGVFDPYDLDSQGMIMGALDDQVKPVIQEKDHTSLYDNKGAPTEARTLNAGPADLEEMDFESLEFMVTTSSMQAPTRSSVQPISAKPAQQPAIFPQDYVISLRKASDLIDRSNFSTITPVITKIPIQPIAQVPSVNVIPGSKRPSNLGAAISNPKQSRTCFEYAFFRLYQSLPRSRGSTVLSITYPQTKLLKPFEFDIPEPLTFEIRKPHATQKPKASIPASRRNRQTHVPKNKSKSKSSATPTVAKAPGDAEPERLAQTLSQKLELADQSKDQSTPIRLASGSLNAANTPSKPIDRKPLLDEYMERSKQVGDKEVINLIVVGHVDAGKSTLMGNLLYQLGHVSNKQLSKYRWEAQKLGKASFAYAWVLDQTSEERNRGVTMDIAQTSFETKSKRIALMDAPGHKDFVPRVIGGASQADAALLVVNATNGEFETGFGSGGQTREHARLARLLGVSRLIVAVNKMDTVDWSQARFDQIQSQLSHFLKSMNMSGVVFCPVSGLTGTNLVPKSNKQNQTKTDKDSQETGEATLFSWYHGPCLLDIIDSIPSPDRTIDGPFRFVVSDIFKPAGLGVPAVAGRVLSGGVSSGLNVATSKVFCQPSGLPATVKSIRSLCNIRSGMDNIDSGDSAGGLLDQVVKSAFAGDQVALILNGIDPVQSLVPGDVIADPDNPVPLASRISAKVLVFAVSQPITKGYPVIFHYHCTSIGAHVTKLKSMTHKENKVEKTVKKPRCLLGNCTADVEISLERPVCLEVYERCKPLGRFMLRVNGESVAGGTVTAVLPPKKNRLLDL